MLKRQVPIYAFTLFFLIRKTYLHFFFLLKTIFDVTHQFFITCSVPSRKNSMGNGRDNDDDDGNEVEKEVVAPMLGNKGVGRGNFFH